MSKRILVSSPILPPELLARLGAIPDVEVATCKLPELPAAVREADALVVLGLHYSPEVAAALKEPGAKCAFIQLLTAGYELLEEYGVPEQVSVCNAGDVWSPIVAEHTLALLLALVRHLREVETAQRASLWDNRIRPGLDMLYGGNLLIVGMGSIGAEVATRARAFGMHITGVSRAGRPNPYADEMLPIDRLAEGLAKADAIVLAVPYSPATQNLIGAKELATCRPNAVLVNVARGGVVDTDALIAALKAGTIAGAGLDVTEPEPLPPDNPLWGLPNTIISPHLAGAAPPRYMARLIDHVVSNIEAFATGTGFKNQIMGPGR